MRKFYLVALLILSPMAHAWDCSNPVNWTLDVAGNECYRPPTTTLQQTQGQGQTQGQSQNANSQARAASASNSLSSSISRGGNATATGGTTVSNAQGGQGGNSSSGGNSYDSNESTPRQTPPAFAGNVEPTASCKNARNGGASAPIAGLSFGWSTSDDECDLRETARMFYQLGQTQLAVALLCQSKAAKRLPACAYMVPAPIPVAAVAPVDAVTHAELQDVIRRLFQRTTSK
jgi:hypothetical protein